MSINYVGYHATDFERANRIVQKNFEISPNLNRLPCDLGRGVYFFIDDEEQGFEGEKNSLRYVRKYKKMYRNYKVIKSEIKVSDENKVLNMNLAGNIRVFNKFISKNEKVIKDEISVYSDNSNIFNRGNFNGLVLEIMLEHYKLDLDVILCDTFTPFYSEFPNYRLSNIKNGKEICVRNLKVIENKCIIN